MAMTGEYAVASQLHRLGISASVTYGNAKKVDIVAFNELANKFTLIEVKSSDKGAWRVGSRVPEPSGQIWVFVDIDTNPIEPLKFYILTQKNIHDELIDEEIAYMKRYFEKHGKEYGDKPGFCSIKRKHTEKYQNNWNVVFDRVLSD